MQVKVDRTLERDKDVGGVVRLAGGRAGEEARGAEVEGALAVACGVWRVVGGEEGVSRGRRMRKGKETRRTARHPRPAHALATRVAHHPRMHNHLVDVPVTLVHRRADPAEPRPRAPRARTRARARQPRSSTHDTARLAPQVHQVPLRLRPRALSDLGGRVLTGRRRRGAVQDGEERPDGGEGPAERMRDAQEGVRGVVQLVRIGLAVGALRAGSERVSARVRARRQAEA